MIQVILNGQPESLQPELSVLALLEARGLAGKRLAVERNGEIVPKARHAEVKLADGDKLEIVVAVVRYYGGVNLGTGGLIVAYRTAADEALSAAKVEEHLLYTRYRLRFPFDLINPVMMLLRSEEAITIASDTDTEGYIWDVDIADRDVEKWESAASDLYKLDCKRVDESEMNITD